MATSNRSRRSYTDSDKGRAYAAWMINDRNNYRTAKQLDMPLPTLREWIKHWDRHGAPSPEVMAEAEATVEEYLPKAEALRDQIMEKLRELIPQATEKHITPLMTGFGILTDKIDRAKGIGTRVEHEHRHSLPSVEESVALLGAFMRQSIDAATDRQGYIDAVVVEEQPDLLGLPAVTDNEE